jgi:Reverse transcriptase (RNA-dependent DNA polymerase)
MASPIVCALKPKDHEGHQGVRIAIDYKYVNRFTVPLVAPLEVVSDLLQEVGQYKILSLFDVKSGYHHCKVAERDRWLTSFICDDGQFEWTRIPFGMRSSGTTFVRAIKLVLQPMKEFSKSFVDDMVVHSNDWQNHLVS